MKSLFLVSVVLAVIAPLALSVNGEKIEETRKRTESFKEILETVSRDTGKD